MLSLFRHALRRCSITTTAKTAKTTTSLQQISFPLGNHIDLVVPGVSALKTLLCRRLCCQQWPTMTTTTSSLAAVAAAANAAVASEAQQYRYFSSDSNNRMENKTEKVPVDKEELKKRLTPLQYQVTQEAATERPFTGCYNKHYEKGVYQCIVCHQDLFSSDTKYDSGCGWPAFNDVLDKGKITLHRDASIPGGNILLLIKHPERIRTEVRCAKCSAHMGHVFEDGPKPTRKRYCINSAAIEFISAEDLNKGAAAGIHHNAAANVNTATPIAQQ